MKTKDVERKWITVRFDLVVISAVMFFVLLCMVGRPALALDVITQSPGSMQYQRSGHTATLLKNNKVLVTGGKDRLGMPQATAEIFDPLTGFFSETGTMNSPRRNHTATLLNDGTVLIAGGEGNSTAELYDPSTGQFTPVGSMANGITLNTATLLQNGRVLVRGDYGFSQTYDPVSRTFIYVWTLNGFSQQEHTATLLNNGKVLLAGGRTSDLTVTNDAQLYTPDSNPTSPAEHDNGSFANLYLLSSRTGHAATLLANGKVLITGGNNGVSNLSTSEIYDPATSAFSIGNFLTSPRSGHTSTTVGCGKTLLIGGLVNGSFSRTVEIYDPSNNSFQLLDGLLETGRVGHTSTLLSDGRVLIVGGDNEGMPFYKALSSAELLSYGVDLIIPSMPTPPPATANTEQSIYFTVALKNQGQLRAETASRPVGIYLSDDNLITTADRRIGFAFPNFNLAPGEERILPLGVTIPVVPSGTYYIGVIADDANYVAESNEINNVSAVSQIAITRVYPDLVISNSNPPLAANAGQVILVPFTVKNQGQSKAGGNYEVRLYLSDDSIITENDTYIGRGVPKYEMRAGTEQVVDTYGTIPVGKRGSYYIGAIVDPYNVVLESDENNNASAGSSITIN
ncbi:hypothetical protein KI809_16755 [Geobacter pelophilus]|uniref:CARDB domain-containing protein n=1 Tax=Geoanaerobacter pelophilus TaxID=60036 RepID=A0AAW4LA59_9BACT|nr:kelch repeat-containing protein [Geoanaerobacter pelophilus]MBT0665963.1 hypothetical protein [Geoanaerobacter pelophilus]